MKIQVFYDDFEDDFEDDALKIHVHVYCDLLHVALSQIHNYDDIEIQCGWTYDNWSGSSWTSTLEIEEIKNDVYERGDWR